MNNIAFVYVALVVATVSVSQVLLKIGANRSVGKSVSAPYTNPYTIVAYCLYLVNTVLGVYALKNIELSFFYAATSLKFLVIFVLSVVFLKERVNKYKVAAILLIFVGVLVFNY